MSTNDTQPEDKFQSDLRDLINKHSLESASNTQDFILAEFLVQTLGAFNYAVNYRESLKNIKSTNTTEEG